MEKFLTGSARDYDNVATGIRTAKSQFLAGLKELQGTKGEYRSLKEQRKSEKNKLKLEEVEAKKFKFAKMEKKAPFFPSLAAKGAFEEKKSIDASESYFDARQRQLLLFPARAFEKDKKWQHNKFTSNYLSRLPGREGEIVDNEKVRFYEMPRGSVSHSRMVDSTTLNQGSASIS